MGAMLVTRELMRDIVVVGGVAGANRDGRVVERREAQCGAHGRGDGGAGEAIVYEEGEAVGRGIC